MRPHKVMLVFRKDWREVSRNWQVILPIVVVPFIFSVLLPAIILLIPNLTPMSGSNLGGFEAVIRSLPKNVQDEIAGMTDHQVLFYVMSLYFFISSPRSF